VPNREDVIYQIIPISYYDYSRLMQKPYQYPPKRAVWRLITKNISANPSGVVDSSDSTVAS
jgi:hypothetical protein